MRSDYPAWLTAQGYIDRTRSTQVSQLLRVEKAYGAIEDVIARGGYDALIDELTYSTADERTRRPNPSRLEIEGSIRNGLASYKNSVVRYRRFLTETPQPLAPDRPAATEAEPPDETLDRQRLSLERDMQTALRADMAALEPGLSVIDDGAERAVPTGFIDILAQDPAGAAVVIELKAGKTDARVVGQILGYMGDIAALDEPPAVRGIIVAHDFDARTRSAARAVPNLRLVRYAVTFRFQQVAP